MQKLVRRLIAFLLVLAISLGIVPGFAHALPLETQSPKKKYDSYAEEKAAIIEENKISRPAMYSATGGTISNSYIQCVIHDNGGINIGTSDGDCLLYSYPGGNTSETLIRIDSSDYFFGNYVSNITFGSDGKSATATAEIDGIVVKQIVKITKNPNTNTENLVSIEYVLENNSGSSKRVGARIMLDTMLSSNDGAPFIINGQSVTTEKEFLGSSIPKYYQALDSLTNPNLTATGYFFANSTADPDKVQFVHWGSIVNAPWNFQIDPARVVTGDSAVAAYFNERNLPANTCCSFGTAYGAYDTNAIKNYDEFHYDNNTYSPELAKYAAKFSAYAYQAYQFSSTKSVFYEVEDGAADDTEKNNRSKVLNTALSKERFVDIKSYNYNCPTEDSATYTIARKKVNHNGTVRDLVIVVIRGTNMDEWKGNMNVTGTTYAEKTEHYSFRNGADQIRNSLSTYITSRANISEPKMSSNPMVLITGHSRGGGIGNLLAADLVAGKLSVVDSSAVYAYLFAVPNCTTSPNANLTNIFNFCFTDDFVPSLPLKPSWSYGKHGTTFTYTADNDAGMFYLFANESAKLSQGRVVNFDAAKTTAVLKFVKDNWSTVSKYYKQEVSSIYGKTLYKFMHNVVAPAAMDLGADKLQIFAAKSSPHYGEIANFFVDGTAQRKSINDTHQMYNYYNALVSGVFNTSSSTSVSANNYAAAAVSDELPDNAALEQAALIAFANTGSNLELLGWNLEDPSSWTGITWDDNNRVGRISLWGLGLTGSLDLSSFNCLTEIEVGSNALEKLILPNAETSVLSWLECAYNNLKELEISGQPLELLDCSDNYLDENTIAEAAASIPLVSCGNQKPVGTVVYSVEDCAVLTGNVLTNSTIWDITASPDSWVGVTWEADNGTYYVTRLELDNCELSGELDVSGLSHLTYLSCSGNSITSIDTTGCSSLAFLNCCNNKISDITTTSSLENLYCDGNLLTDSTIEAIGAETTEAGHQEIQASVSDFCPEEYSVLSSVAETLNFGSGEPGSWSFVHWENHGGIYHAAELDLADFSEVTGELDLSDFEYLEDLYCSGTGIESVILPDQMTSLSDRAFSGCASLVSVQFPAGMEEIGEYAFYNCSVLTDIILPAALETVESNAFDSCEALERLVFPSGISNIEAGAFQNCSNLQAAYFTGNAPECSENAFLFGSIGFTVYYLDGTEGWDGDDWSSYITDTYTPLSIKTYPDQLNYYINEELSTNGMVLLLLNADGSFEEITSGYTVSCEDLDEPGVYTVTVTYGSETTTYSVSVVERSISSAYVYFENDQYTYNYTGSEITPAVTVIYNGTELTEDVDYTVSYENNMEPGQGTVIITGINLYSGTVQISFSIVVNSTVTVTEWTELESSHDYYSQSEQTWIYNATDSNAEYIRVTFDEATCFEEGYDYLHIYDSTDTLCASYTGTTLAGQTITVTGNVLKLVLTSDESVTFWGFKVTDLKEVYSQKLDISISQNTIAAGNTAQITVEGYGDISYSSSDETVAVVDENGIVTGVADGTAIITVNASGDDTHLEATGEVTITVSSDAPVTPVITLAAHYASGKPQVSWETVEGAASYKVYRANKGSSEFAEIASVAETNYIDTDAVAGSLYRYKVTAVSAAGLESEFSNMKSRTCDLARPVVKASNVASSGKIKLTWDAVEGAQKYYIYRAASKTGDYKYIYSTTKTSFINSKTEAGTSYYYRVKAVHTNTAANSARSLAVSRTCDLARPVVKASNVASSGKIKLTWDAVEGASKYYIYRAVGKNGEYKYIYSTTKTSFTNSSIEAGTAYYYKVKAVHAKTAANSAQSYAAGRTCDLARPVVSISLSSSGKPKLTWDAIDGAVKYYIYRSTSKDGEYTYQYATTKTSYTNTKAEAGVTYYYKVKAVHENTAANSALSYRKYIKSK